MTLSTTDLHVELGDSEILKGIDLQLRPGWTAVVGPNGAGKSTLLRALAGLLKPSWGSVQLNGRDLHKIKPADRAQHIAWLAQQGDTSGDLTVRETVELGRIAQLGLFRVAGAADHAAVARAMAITECSDWAERRLSALSGGERQRVLLARVLADQLILMREGRVVAEGSPADPQLRQALVELFDGAVRWQGERIELAIEDMN
jgi:iron complex transport system ATP-binding protein